MEHSTTHPRIPAITHPAITHPSITQPLISKKTVFVVALSLFGVFSVSAGLLSLVGSIILSSNASPSLVNTLLADAAYEFFLGAMIFAGARAFVKGKILSVWLYGGSILIDSLYNLLTGYPLNYVFVAFGLLIIWQILSLRMELELS